MQDAAGTDVGEVSSSPCQAPTEVLLEEIDGELVLWRVFGLSDVIEDRPLPEWTVEQAAGPGADDLLQISIGDAPSELMAALRQWRAQVPSILNAHVGHPITYGDIEEEYQKGLSDETPAPFLEPYLLWFTMRLSRPTHQRTPVGVTPLWLAHDIEAVTREMSTFEKEGNQFLDGALARLLGALPPMNVSILRYPGREAWLLVPGRPGWRVPRPKLNVKDSGVLVERRGGWAATVPTVRLEETVRSLPRGEHARALGKQTAKATTFFTSARAAADEDDLGRFVYAFAGLELLVTQVEGQSRLRLLERMAQLDAQAPYRELFWPSTGEDWTGRNLIFKFALMAWLHSPETAQEDVDVCKRIARTRNDLFHGNELSDQLRVHGVQCTELLRRYLGLVAADEAMTAS